MWTVLVGYRNAPVADPAGKRLRPALVFASAACGGPADTSDTIKCAASVELMHLSSLIHDDLMDESASRGGVPTLHVTIGRDAAILAGDYLLAAGGGLVAGFSGEAAAIWHRGYAQLCVGQAKETSNRYRADTTMPEYLAAVRGKTATLMSIACRLGGLCSGLTVPQTGALADFGDAFGMVFQLIDDLMDVVSTERLWRKPVRQDMANGVYTACTIAALADPRSRLRDLLGEQMTTAQIEQAHDEVCEFGMTAALDLIEDHVHRAETALGALPPSTARARLATLPRRYVCGALANKVAPGYQRMVSSPVYTNAG